MPRRRDRGGGFTGRFGHRNAVDCITNHRGAALPSLKSPRLRLKWVYRRCYTARPNSKRGQRDESDAKERLGAVVACSGGTDDDDRLQLTAFLLFETQFFRGTALVMRASSTTEKRFVNLEGGTESRIWKEGEDSLGGSLLRWQLLAEVKICQSFCVVSSMYMFTHAYLYSAASLPLLLWRRP